MSKIIVAILLGIIQGLTEFLPVSSSGHLEITAFILKHFGNSGLPQQNLLMTVVLHAATAFSTLYIFRKEVGEIIKGLLQFKWNNEFKFSLKIILSMIPAALVGLIFDEQIDSLFNGQILLVGGMLILTGLLLYVADKAKNTNKKVSFSNSILIGIAQAIAILPGISRSGATISVSVLLGIDREKAARFSFLMVVPLILGKMAKDIMSGEISSESATLIPLIAGFIAAFITGLLACKWMISLVKNSQLKYFSFYCFTVGALAIIFSIF
ncbi:undecaprenyl-diphosphate phosphatase [Flavobacteriales bacterium]|nr:undecaprenyl-diphosphate phosphatase [Flavobacteriales bacterium]